MDSPPHVADEFCSWLDLPPELMESILLRVGAGELLMRAQNVCSLWHRLCKEPSMWRSVDMRRPKNAWMSYSQLRQLRQLCCVAVDRSCGQLVDINVEYLGTNELLKYIADSSSQLKRLRLVGCFNISDEGLREAVAKLPLLEELDISYCSFSKGTLEAVGRCCQLLKTLKLNSYDLNGYPKLDEEAFAIAQNVHELQHFKLVGNNLTDDGLQAILDGCPHLESLDIHWCKDTTLVGNLGRRYVDRIKDIRRSLYTPMTMHIMDSQVPSTWSNIYVMSYKDLFNSF